ncbi:MAG: ankyrin repeat domain-containing protein [Actinomycetota bacterium]|nr:ankyrin repeat domain-containing protein [Actinomycetota bacterium]
MARNTIEERDENGVLLALKALYEGREEEAERLRPPDERLTLAEAAAFGRLARMEDLLSQDAVLVNSYTPDGFTPLHLGVFGRHVDAVRLLLERGADVEAMSQNAFVRVRPLGTAAFVRETAIARLLLDQGADPNGAGEGGFRPLHTAAQNGDADFTRLLLDHGADPSVAADDGRTPADVARDAGHASLVATLRGS